MRMTVILFVICVLGSSLFVAGCGNVSLRGDALTAAETSTVDAYDAAERAGATTTTQPSWQQSYLVENFKQWRSFVRSAKKDLIWGPKLEGE